MKKKKKPTKFPKIKITSSWINSCDHCIHQGEDGHYCNLREKVMKNMDIKRCGAFEDKIDSNHLKY